MSVWLQCFPVWDLVWVLKGRGIFYRRSAILLKWDFFSPSLGFSTHWNNYIFFLGHWYRYFSVHRKNRNIPCEKSSWIETTWVQGSMLHSIQLTLRSPAMAAGNRKASQTLWSWDAFKLSDARYLSDTCIIMQNHNMCDNPANSNTVKWIHLHICLQINTHELPHHFYVFYFHSFSSGQY